VAVRGARVAVGQTMAAAIAVASDGAGTRT